MINMAEVEDNYGVLEGRPKLLSSSEPNEHKKRRKRRAWYLFCGHFVSAAASETYVFNTWIIVRFPGVSSL